MTWKEKYKQDPEIAESIIETLQRDLKESEDRCEKLEKALERIRDYHGNWALSMRQIAKEALEN